MQDMKSKIAVITGANRGLGFAMSEKLASLGAKVIMACRSKKSGEEAVSKLKDKKLDVVLEVVDVEKPGDIEKLGKELAKKYPVIDVLINNAGINSEGGGVTIETLDLPLFEKIMNINLRGTVLMCKYLIPMLKKSSSGRIINFSSGLGQLTVPRMGPYPSYSISKTAVNGLTKKLADELKGTKIMVFSLDPGWVKTDMGGPEAPLPISEGIDTPIWLATEDAAKLHSGEFYKERKILGW